MLLNGYVMSKDIVVAEVINNHVNIVRKDLCPLLLLRTKDIEEWLTNRVVDKHRPSSRVLRKILRLKTSNDLEIVTKFNAMSLTDTYWFKEFDSPIEWDEAVKVVDYFSSIIEKGNIDYDRLPNNLRTFELTNVGRYEKCWKLNNGRWVLLKRGSEEEVISEQIAFLLGRELGLRMAEYKIVDKTLITTKNFIDNWNYNFEDAYSIVGDDEDIVYNCMSLLKINRELLTDYLNMLVLDTLILNVDRNTHNYGVLRNVNTGEILSMAPLYDHNMCLYGSKMKIKEHSPDMFFIDIEDAKKLCPKYKLPELDINMLDKITNDKIIKKFIYNNYLKIKEIFE